MTNLSFQSYGLIIRGRATLIHKVLIQIVRFLHVFRMRGVCPFYEVQRTEIVPLPIKWGHSAVTGFLAKLLRPARKALLTMSIFLLAGVASADDWSRDGNFNLSGATAS